MKIGNKDYLIVKEKKSNSGVVTLISIGASLAIGASVIMGLKYLLKNIDPKDEFIDGEWISDDEI